MHFLWTDCRVKCFLGCLVPFFSGAAVCTSFRTPLRLFPDAARVQFTPLPNIKNTRSILRPVNTAVHRFQELIGGHPYLIEVAAVASDRWRACIVRIPGVPTALMPFYGPTPDEAASQLRQWLVRAHERAHSGARRG